MNVNLYMKSGIQNDSATAIGAALEGNKTRLRFHKADV